MRHKVDWYKKWCKVGDRIPVYPINGKPFWATVTKLHKNKYGRISYHVRERDLMVFAEELFPGKDDIKLRMKGNL